MSDPIPEARVTRRRFSFLVWLLPLVAIGAAVYLMKLSMHEAGVRITVRFPQGYGLKAEDTVRYRGIIIGVVEELSLSEDLEGILVSVRLDPAAANLAREGCQFWIVRPQLAIGGATGLETVIGAKYISVLPGPRESPLRRVFQGLEDAPLVAEMDPRGLKIIATTPSAGGLKPGAPVSYRQVAIGKVIGMGLTKDASEVEARLYIEPQYAPLVRENSQFWKFSGASIRAGLFTGIQFDVESMSSLLLGGIAMATPPDPGPVVQSGAVFALAEEAGEGWADWVSHIPLRDAPGRDGEVRPAPVRAVLTWTETGLFRDKRLQRHGWVIPVGDALIGPANLLCDPVVDPKRSNAFELVVDERAFYRALPEREEGQLVARLAMPEGWRGPAIPMREAAAPEDVIIQSGTGMADKLIGVDKLVAGERGWRVEGAVHFDRAWHGAPVLADADKRFLAVLLVDSEGGGYLVPVMGPP